MTDTVLQSFCERCGTRYTFTEQDTRRESGLSKLGRSLGLRSTPRPTGEPTVATALPTHDPFRATFHFCLECRQYTCQSCWNADAGYCQTCYPLAEVDLRAAELEASVELRSAGPAAFAAAAPVATGSAWPTTDLDRASRAPSTAASFPTPTVADEPPPGDAPSGFEAAADVPAVDTDAPSADPDERPDRTGDTPGFVDPWSGRESIAAAILRAAGTPTPEAPPIEPRADAADAPAADVWGITPVAADGGSTADAIDAGSPPQDPWRGLVFSDDDTPSVEVAADEGVTPPQPDPNLPWLAAAATAEVLERATDEAMIDEPLAGEQVDDTASDEATPVADREATDATHPSEAEVDAEAESDVDHRGWIAASTVAAGTGWSTPMRSPWDEDAGAARPDEEASGDAVSVDAPESSTEEPAPAEATSLAPHAAADRDIAIVDLDEDVSAEAIDVVWVSEPEAGDAVAPPEPVADDAGDAAPVTSDGEVPSWPVADRAAALPWPSTDTRPSVGPTRLEADADLAPAADQALAAAVLSEASGARDDRTTDAVEPPGTDAAPEATASPDPAPAVSETPVTPEPPTDPFARSSDPAVLPAEPWMPSPTLAPLAALSQPMPPRPPAPVSPASASASLRPPGPPPAAAPPPFSVAPADPLAPPPAPAVPPPTPTPTALPLGAIPSAPHVLRPAEHPVAPPAPPATPPLMLAPQPPPFQDVAAAHPPFGAPLPGSRPPAPPPVAAPPRAGTAQAGAGAKARPCHNCALPLSAKARFCRRCGAQQAA